ncbi:MAG: hypothetical protein IT381_09380 [Deltaproteobacteria bacterium]|nr:hypothetical protein [Deltaproteobacteria bacterium]
MLILAFMIAASPPKPTCADEPRLVSPGGTAATAFGVINASTDPIRVYWRDFDGGRRLEAVLPADGPAQRGKRRSPACASRPLRTSPRARSGR